MSSAVNSTFAILLLCATLPLAALGFGANALSAPAELSTSSAVSASPTSPTLSAAIESRLRLHAGKAGLYLRFPKAPRTERPDFFLSHPLVDAAFAGFNWADIEPSPGQFNFAEIDEILDLCRKHAKGMVLGIAPYGQQLEDQPTPEWLYEMGVKRLRFAGGGGAKGGMITVPKVWDEAYLREYGKFIAALGRRYNGVAPIWYVKPGIGHIGNLTAQPSKGGAPAFLAEGWTPEVWMDFSAHVVGLYQEAFPDTPLLAVSETMLLRERDRDYYHGTIEQILEAMAARGVSIVSFGLEPDVETLRRTGIPQRYGRFGELAARGEIRFGAGDDWPLWVPQERRTDAFIKERDDDGLARELQYAFGGVEGIPESHISILYVLHPETEASHPEMGAAQNKEVYRLLEAARARLKREDPIARLGSSIAH